MALLSRNNDHPLYAGVADPGKPDPTKIYVAMCSALTSHGQFKRGERLRGSHPAVVERMPMFREEGLSDAEEMQLWRDRFGDALR